MVVLLMGLWFFFLCLYFTESLGVVGVIFSCVGYYWPCVFMGLFVISLNLLDLWVTAGITMGYFFILCMASFCWGVSLVHNVVSGGVVKHLSHYSVSGVAGVMGVILPTLELVSVLVRPLTLGVRLATNISSGHVLLQFGGLVMGVLSGVLVVVVMLLLMLEVFVGLLQGFIFGALVVMYMMGE
nr:ATP synthase F0 subunit 6 [Pseudoacanthocephalus sp.]